ncbi:unnamed protein product, partial [Pylaiella littoralis]
VIGYRCHPSRTRSFSTLPGHTESKTYFYTGRVLQGLPFSNSARLATAVALVPGGRLRDTTTGAVLRCTRAGREDRAHNKVLFFSLNKASHSTAAAPTTGSDIQKRKCSRRHNIDRKKKSGQPCRGRPTGVCWARRTPLLQRRRIRSRQATFR